MSGLLKSCAVAAVLGCGSCLDIPTKEIAPGVAMPLVSIGTWTEGTKKEDLNVSAIVGNWLSLGARGIDTAYAYFDQKDVAEAIASSGVARKDLFITSKIPTCLGKALTRYFVEYDLKKLNTDYLDLLLIHAPGLPGPLGGCDDTWAVLEEYHAKGALKAIGVSNWGPKQFEGLKYTVPPAVNQIEYNVFTHNEETEKYCKAHNITIEAWSPLGDPARTHKSVFTEPAVTTIAGKHNVSAAQVALKWILQKGNTLTFLSSNKDHQGNDADLFRFTLADDEMATLDGLNAPSPGAADIIV
eukprot:TRINITY_DN15687_c0_g2_i1.p1 TRINITY_DN15687_c0_g2~~TRINITY_DN15687_c0_g2_i1.p1  ORF type:complete len:321 (+),score=68.35 TRINITY_DN15687_c0_g2_i1:69-965(+)